MDNILIILALTGFLRLLYEAIGQPLSNYDNNAILISYTNIVSRIIAKIHKIEIPKDIIPFYQVENLVNKYYKFLGFCYICMASWCSIIFCNCYFENIEDKIKYTGVSILINFIIKKWTV